MTYVKKYHCSKTEKNSKKHPVYKDKSDSSKKSGNS